jgi:hypothetical protein
MGVANVIWSISDQYADVSAADMGHRLGDRRKVSHSIVDYGDMLHFMGSVDNVERVG